MLRSWIRKYVLPREVDFLSAMHDQAHWVKQLTDDLYRCFRTPRQKHCSAIEEDHQHARTLRDNNMRDLLHTFITPVDRESIYRVVTQLDWAAISLRHFALQAEAYGITQLDSVYVDMIRQIRLQAELLTAGFKTIKSDPQKTAQSAARVRDAYDHLVQQYIETNARLIRENTTRDTLQYHELLFQLKDISQHMRMTANSLEDIVMKMA